MENSEDSRGGNKRVENQYPISVPVTSPTGSSSGLTRQVSITKSSNTTCLCSPTTHAGSYRCRLHRIPNLHRTKSMDQWSWCTPAAFTLQVRSSEKYFQGTMKLKPTEATLIELAEPVVFLFLFLYKLCCNNIEQFDLLIVLCILWMLLLAACTFHSVLGHFFCIPTL